MYGWIQWWGLRRVDWFKRWNDIDTACVYIAKYGGSAAMMYPEPLVQWPTNRIARIARKISDMMDKEHSST